MGDLAIRVLVIEDEPAYAQRFSESVRSHARLQLCGTAGTVRQACSLADLLDPDVILVDLGLPDGNGVEVVRHVKARHPGCEALVVSMFGDDDNVVGCIQAGASGYFLKDALPTDITAAILQVCAGWAPMSPTIARRVLQILRHESTVPARGTNLQCDSPDSLLSSRETDVLRLVAKGFNFKEVGSVLDISPNTVVTHVKSIYHKLSVHSRGEAVYEAGQLGLL